MCSSDLTHRQDRPAQPVGQPDEVVADYLEEEHDQRPQQDGQACRRDVRLPDATPRPTELEVDELLAIQEPARRSTPRPGRHDASSPTTGQRLGIGAIQYRSPDSKKHDLVVNNPHTDEFVPISKRSVSICDYSGEHSQVPMDFREANAFRCPGARDMMVYSDRLCARSPPDQVQ